MGFTGWLVRQNVRLFGPPPPTGAPKIESWIFVRRIHSRLLVVVVPLWVLVAVDDEPTWLWILFGVSAAGWVYGFVSVSLRIRRLRSGSSDV